MKIELPVIIQDEIKDGKRLLQYEDRGFELDLSLGCQMRWEANFPQLAEKEDLVGYTERISALKQNTLPVVLAKLKIVYCYFDTDMSFKEFIKMFEFSDSNYVNRLIAGLRSVFETVFASASQKN